MQDLSKMSVEELVSVFADPRTWVRSDPIVRQLSAELTRRMTPPEGHVRLPDGKDVKVLGTLPMTADGVVVGEGASPLWIWTDDDGLQNDGTSRLHLDHYDDYPVEYAYSTHEAAEAARAKEGK